MSRNTGETTGSPSKASIRLGGSRRGPVLAALEAAIKDVDPLRGEARVFAELARQAARVLDAAYRVHDADRVLRATRELRELVDLLPLRAVEQEGGKRDDDDRGRGRVLELLDAPAGVGD